MRIAPRTSAPVVAQDSTDVDDFVAAKPQPKPVAKPKPMEVKDGFDGAPQSVAQAATADAPKPAAPAPTLADLPKTAPKAFQEMVLKQAGLDDDTLAKMSDDQIADAFKQVVDQSGKPGKHTIDVHLTQYESHDAGGDGGGTVTTSSEATQKLSFSSKAIGDVNGMRLDPAALAETAHSVHLLDSQTVSDTMNAMGFSNYGGLDDQGMRDLLTTAMVAARTPGAHEVSIHQQESVSSGGDGGDTHVEERTYSLKFDSDKKGIITVDGKPLPTANTLAMSEMLEAVPTAQQRTELIGAGFPADKVNSITPEEVHQALTHVSVELSRPGGVKEFEVKLGGDDFKVNPKLDSKGKLQSLEISEKPKSKSRWKKFTDGLKKVAGPILTVLSFIPITAPFAIAANAALSVYNGIKNHNPLGVIAGIAGGVVGFAGDIASAVGDVAASTVSDVAQTVANVANTASAGLAAIKGKNPGSILGFIAGAAGNLAGWVGDGAQGVADTLRDVSSTARTAQTVVNGVDAARRGDALGVLNAGNSLVNTVSRSSSSSSGSTSSTGLDGVTERQAAVGDENDGYDAGSDPHYEANFPSDSTESTSVDNAYVPAQNDPEETTQPTITPVSDVSADPSMSEDSAIVVQKGDTLTSLALEYYGDAGKAALLYEYNKQLIGPDRNMLRAGTELAIPPADFTITREQNNAFWNGANLPGASPSGGTVQTEDGPAITAPDNNAFLYGSREMYDLEKDFTSVLGKMTSEGRRIDMPGWVNNLYGTGQVVAGLIPGVNTDPVAGCQGQAIEMASAFKSDPQLRAEYQGWSFDPISNFPSDAPDWQKYAPGSGYHWVIQATSPDGHRYMLDPNNGRMDAWTHQYDAWRFQ